jgi:glycosyltransferase involved in cell wall biosynthesis
MAMWLAKPTVVSDVLAVAEYIDDSRTGVLVDGSAAGYEAALRRLRDPENAAAVADMAQAARRCVIDTYSFDAYVRCILDELASLPSPWHV